MRVRVNNGGPIDPPKKQGGETGQPKYDVNRDFSGETVELSQTEAVTLDYATKLLGGADYSNYINTGYLGLHLPYIAGLKATGQMDSRIGLNSEGNVDRFAFDINNPQHQEHLYGNLATLIEMVRTEPDKKERARWMEALNNNIAWIMDPSMRQNLEIQAASDPESPTGMVFNFINTGDDQPLGHYPSGADSHDGKGPSMWLKGRQWIGYGSHGRNGYNPTANTFHYDEAHGERIPGSKAKQRGYPVEVHHVREHPTDPNKNREVYKPVRMEDFMNWQYDNGNYSIHTLMNHLATHGTLSMYGELNASASDWLGLPKEYSAPVNHQYYMDNIVSPYIIYDRWMDKFNAMRLDQGKPIVPQKGLETVPNPKATNNQ